MSRPNLPCYDLQAPDLFFSPDPRDIEAAMEICRSCPQQEACYQSAVLNGERYGVWGGRLQEELREQTVGRRVRKVVATVVAA